MTEDKYKEIMEIHNAIYVLEDKLDHLNMSKGLKVYTNEDGVSIMLSLPDDILKDIYWIVKNYYECELEHLKQHFDSL